MRRGFCPIQFRPDDGEQAGLLFVRKMLRCGLLHGIASDAHDPESRPPRIREAEEIIKSDPGNIALRLKLGNSKLVLQTIVLVSAGMIIGYLFYPPAILICCLLSIVLPWILPKIKNLLGK